ncbi:MAG TPA: SRPBCC family protein, partial [Candidatus Binatus sp.]|nr:SRPBCC family protein [Candidatus Binatus sp.]
TDPPNGAGHEKIDLSDVNMDSGAALELPATGISGTKFDSVVVIGEYGHAIGGPTNSSAGNSVFDKTWRTTERARAALGPVGVEVAGHPNIFPTTWIAVSVQLSLRIPRDPGHTEIWWFTFVDRNLPRETRDFMVTLASRVFGPGGVLEQDDGENWAQATAQTRGIASRRMKHHLAMGLGQGKIIKEGGLARIEGVTSEHGQLWTYHSWAQWMKGLGWDELRNATTPGEFI